MKGRFILFVILILMMRMVTSGIEVPKIIVTEKDKALLQAKFDQFSNETSLSVGGLMLKIGNDFKGTPYVGKTLDLTTDENLVVNLHELDCTTFVENCLAIALTIKGNNPTFENFVSELEKIRYRNGVLNGYGSRLHYFGEWITDNQAKEIVEDISSKLGGEIYPVVLNFMSSHPDSYPQLKGNGVLTEEIKKIELRVSSQPFFYIPKEKIALHERDILDGDIVALTTRIPGMDVSHVGILYKKDGRVYLLHASSSGAKVETTRIPLADYLKDSKNTTGIFVVRAR